MENENNQNYQNNKNYKNNYLVTEQDFNDSQIFYDNKGNRQDLNQYANNTPNQNEEEPKQKKPFDAKLAIVTVQIVMCTAIIAVCLVLKSFSADLFGEMKTWYATNVEDKTSTKQVLDSSSSPSGSSSGTSSSVISSESPSSGASSKSSTSSGVASSKGSLTTSNSAFVSAEGGPPDVVQNSFSFDDVRQTMATTNGGGNALYTPVKGKITSTFGYRTDPISGTYSFHDGLDIGADTGTAIHAAMGGVVETAGSDTYYGNYVLIKHNNNFKTVYGHCSTLKVKAGQTVKVGDIIALVGSTGRSTGPHLHFEVRIGGQKVDPKWFLGADYN